MTKEKDFKQSKSPCYPAGIAYDSDKYRVVEYQYLADGRLVPPYWKAYTRTDGMLITTLSFTDKNSAIKACLEHERKYTFRSY